MKYRRPHGTTANPQWPWISAAEELIPSTDDTHGRGERMLRLTQAFMLTQGPYAGRRLGEAILPWQVDATRYIFGQTDENGDRIVRRVGMLLGKGSSKTTLLAAWALAFVIDSVQRNTNRRGLVAIVAAGLASANIAFQAIAEAIAADEHLAGQFKSYTARRALKHMASGIEIRVLPPTLDAAVGLRPTFLAIDEIHVAAEENKDFSTVIDQLRRGGANWGPEYLEIGVTTAPVARSVGFFSEWLGQMQAVRDGKTADPTTLPILFQWPMSRDDISPDDHTQWFRGMPSLITTPGGRGTMDAGQMQRELEEAQREGGAGQSLELLLSQRLGILPAERKFSTKVSLADLWGQAPRITALPKGEMVVIALDPASGMDDVFSVVIGVQDANGDTHFWHRGFLLSQGLERLPKSERSPFDQAIECGELTLHESYPKLEQAVFDLIDQIERSMGVRPIVGGDRYGVAGLVARLQERRGEGWIDVSQGWKLASALAAAEGMLSGGQVRHAHQPLMQWALSNLVIDTSGTTTRFRKADSGLSGQGARKIDPAMALLSAVQLVSEGPRPPDIHSMIG